MPKQNFIIGVDEAGRGAWAGPVAVGAILISVSQADQLKKLGVKDSKKLSLKKRTELFDSLTSKFRWSVGLVSSQEIDRIGIQAANVRAVELALSKLPFKKNQIKII